MLDLATGTGWAALAAAEAVGPSGRVVATDLAEEPLEIARRKAAERGLDRIEFTTGDMVAPAHPDASFDAVLCAWRCSSSRTPSNACGPGAVC